MNTEKTDIIIENPRRGWVLYDGACGMCISLANRFHDHLRARGFFLARIQEPWVMTRLGLAPEEPLTEMALITDDGKVLRGADAVIHISRFIWWAWPLILLAGVPGGKLLLHAAYQWIAIRRHCLSGACGMNSKPHANHREELLDRRGSNDWLGTLPLAILLFGVPFLRGYLQAWEFMWVYAIAIFAGLKWLTLMKILSSGLQTNQWRIWSYLFLYPGMDAEKFLRRAKVAPRPSAAGWIGAVFYIALGVLLIWIVAPLTESRPLLSGWIGMIGLILTLHFGIFELVCLIWRSGGIDAVSIMQTPLRAKSLSDFWSHRWNLGFRRLTHDYVFVPATKSMGLRWGLFASFFASGLIHDLVISFPARGGYGLPTSYFSLQGLGIIMERSFLGKRLHLQAGLAGKLHAFAFTIIPLFWLFHPVFVKQVILPFMRVLRAI